MNPETCSCSWPAWRTALDERTSLPAFVADSPFGSRTSMVAARYLPDGIPASRHTLISAVSLSHP
ncbi:hypothetical protein [Pseudarthrobacter sp. H2]|uniref:hypothetical protein n=1 Tax=Pseudarthrobacter sp. H2 TaxID=3418415 RepID=UPI003CEFFF8A